MAENNKKALFWTSYSDLMTSLFFAVLVLFVVVVVAMGAVKRNTQKIKQELEIAKKELKNAQEELGKAKNEARASKEQLNQILRLDKQFKTLTSSTSLQYDTQKRMFYVKDFVGIEIFEPNKCTIKEKYLETVDTVGTEIKQIIESLKKENKDFSYLLVIEGTAAIPYKKLKKDTFDPDNHAMYELSYQRALALYERWKKLNFRDSNTEIIIAGSGFNGINRDKIVEDNNKRFVIQIIPKIEKPAENEKK